LALGWEGDDRWNSRSCLFPVSICFFSDVGLGGNVAATKRSGLFPGANSKDLIIISLFSENRLTQFQKKKKKIG
jgi:hypothetical protein